MRKALTLLGFALFAAPVPAVCPVTAGGPHAGLDTFDAVWDIVNRRHFDPEFNGVDWDAAREDMRPRAEAAEDMVGVRAVIAEMLGLLGQSHFFMVEKEHLGGGAKGSEASPPGTAGFDLRFRDGAALVSRVEPAGPAAAAGVRLGWVLTTIDDATVEEVLAELPDKKTLRPETLKRDGLLSRIDGEVGTRVRFGFETGAGGETLELTRAERDAIPFDLPGLPRLYLVLRSERFEHRGFTIGVVHFSNWFDPIARGIDKALFSMRDCDGIVLDLRGNSGGAGNLARRVAGHFFDEQVSLGTQVMRRSSQEYAVRPRRSRRGREVGIFTGPLVILADETTGSCSEIFAGGMQALGRARVIGGQTAGAALPGNLTELPNGDYLLHAVADFITVRGESMEGDGVIPDEVVPLVREDLRRGRDGALDAAADWIRGEYACCRSSSPYEKPAGPGLRGVASLVIGAIRFLASGARRCRGLVSSSTTKCRPRLVAGLVVRVWQVRCRRFLGLREH